MFSMLVNIAINVGALMLSVYLVNGVEVESWIVGGILVVVLTLLNKLLKPILKTFTLPINFLTFGLFSLVLNGVIVLLAAYLVDGFEVAGLLEASIFAVVFWIVNWVMGLLKI